jgi:methyl-accepting chemotaxis protein
MSEDVFRLIVAAGVVLASVAFVAQAVVLLALYRVAKGSEGRMGDLVERFTPLTENAGPALQSIRSVLSTMEENAPRISQISQDIATITRSAREQTSHIGMLVDDATDRATRRLMELDQGVDLAVAQVEQTGQAVKGAVLKPLREVNAVLIGLRTAVVTYAQGRRRPSVDHATQDEEMFI